MNFTRFQSEANFIETVEHDLTAAAQAPVTLTLFKVDDLAISQPEGIYIDQLTPER